VLKGASAALSAPNAPVLQVEFCEENARSANGSCTALFDALIELGYELYEYEPGENRMQLVDRDSAKGNRNLYAVKDLRVVLARLQGSRAGEHSTADLQQFSKPLPRNVTSH